MIFAMYLFHSVKSEDLSTSCLRRRLLEFFENTRPQEIAGINREELELRAVQDNRSVVKAPAPFESWFEIDVALQLVRKGFVVVPQHEVAGKRIDLVVEGGRARLAVECDGDEWHGSDRYEADMQRQRQLERSNWEFFRVRECVFYSNKEDALQALWRALEARGIAPGAGEDQPLEHDEAEGEYEEGNSDKADRNDDDSDVFSLSDPDSEGADTRSDRRPEDVTAAEIQEAILRALGKCPNQSCTIQSMTSRVLKDLGILTRGNPRIEFEGRVMRSLGILERKGLIEKYKAKNRRIRLLQKTD
jgi:very-short-patch-repair endonuclease